MSLLFATAMAEETTELSQALEGATKEEALAAGTILGLGMGIILAIGVVYFILRVIADWKIFTKAGRAGWKSIVPILAEYEEFDLCWQGSLGLLYAVITMALRLRQRRRLRLGPVPARADLPPDPRIWRREVRRQARDLIRRSIADRRDVMYR